MPARTETKPQPVKETPAPRTLIGWQGLLFALPADWNITGFSLDRDNGYLKVDSPGTMFVQMKWTNPGVQKPRTLGDLILQLWRKARHTPAPAAPPDLRSLLDTFLKQNEKQSRKAKAGFESKVKPETSEADGERTAHNFSWSGGGQGQGKIWHCRKCGRVVIAQVVGTPKDNVAAVASQLFGSIQDHPEDGWTTWALYDLVAGIPADFRLTAQKLMSGYLRLDFERKGGERIRVERWGLANVTRKKFTVKEWFVSACQVHDQRITLDEEVRVREHAAVRASGRIRGIASWAKALRDAVFTLKPASLYEACLWECAESNRTYAVQVWHNRRSEGLLDGALARCVCH